MKNIVALVDFSDMTFKVLKEVHALASAFHSQVVLLHVTAKQPVVVDVGLISPTVLQQPSPELIREDASKLEALRESLGKFGVEAIVRQIPASNIDQLLDEVKTLSPDLLVVGSHKHGLLHQLVHGSVTDKVVRHAPCPVLVVPSPA